MFEQKPQKFVHCLGILFGWVDSALWSCGCSVAHSAVVWGSIQSFIFLFLTSKMLCLQISWASPTYFSSYISSTQAVVVSIYAEISLHNRLHWDFKMFLCKMWNIFWIKVSKLYYLLKKYKLHMNNQHLWNKMIDHIFIIMVQLLQTDRKKKGKKRIGNRRNLPVRNNS